MSWITIDKSRCDNCGTCRLRCPSCYVQEGDEILPRGDDAKCIVCGHCLALCPNEAISHARLDQGACAPLTEGCPVSPEAFRDLVMRRRSHRQFLGREIPRELLEELVSLCRCAPTGVNTQAVEIKIMRDAERIAALSRAAVGHFTAQFEAIEGQVAALRREGRAIPEALLTKLEGYSRYRRMGKVLEKGFDPILFSAPCVMLFHASDRARTPHDDCVIAAQTTALGAIPMGLGSCYIGLFTRAAAESEAVLSSVGLPPGNRLYCTLILGFPRLRFLRTVAREPIRATWE